MPPDYDNLIAKLMVHGPDRDAAIDRLRRALDETEIGGVQTTLPFHRFVARSAAFRAADLSTGWVEANWDGEAARRDAVAAALLAAGLAAADEPARPRRRGAGAATARRPSAASRRHGDGADGAAPARLAARGTRARHRPMARLTSRPAVDRRPGRRPAARRMPARCRRVDAPATDAAGRRAGPARGRHRRRATSRP